MAHLSERYSFSDFARQWCEETGDDPGRIAITIAQAIKEKRLVAAFPYPIDTSPDHYGPTEHDPLFEDFCIGVTDHLERLAAGLDAPDFDERLRHVSLLRSDVEVWLQGLNRQLPQFWRFDVADGDASEATSRTSDLTVGERDYRNLQKIVAVLAALVAERGAKFRRGNEINVSQIRDAIREFLDAYPGLAKRLGQGLGRSTLDQKIAEALCVLEEEEDC